MIPNQPRFTILLYLFLSDNCFALSALTRNDISTMFHATNIVMAPGQRWKQSTAQKNSKVGQAEPNLHL